MLTENLVCRRESNGLCGVGILHDSRQHCSQVPGSELHARTRRHIYLSGVEKLFCATPPVVGIISEGMYQHYCHNALLGLVRKN